MVLLCLLIPAMAHAERSAFKAKAIRVIPNPPEDLSCGAGPRMLKDRHTVVFDDQGVKVNGLRWTLDDLSTPPTEALFWFKKERAKISAVMSVWTNDRELLGIYLLVGVTRDRKFCMDQVEIAGERL